MAIEKTTKYKPIKSLDAKDLDAKDLDIGSLYSADSSTPRQSTNPMIGSAPKPAPVVTPTKQEGQGVSGYYAGPVLPEQDPNAVYMDEIHKAAADKNYKALLQSDIAAYNLKMNTKKYLDNELASQGLNTQGYGTTANVGVENMAANLYAQNLENYNAQDATLRAEAEERARQEEQTAEANDLETDKQLYQFLTNFNGTEESLAGYMDDYGYAQGSDGYWYHKDANGNADMSRPASQFIQATTRYATENVGTNVPDYSGASSRDIVAGARNALQNWASNYPGVNRDGYSTVSDLRNAEVGRLDKGGTGKLGDIVGNELDYIEDRISGGTVQDGTLFKLQRGSGHNEAYLVLYLDGKLYVVSDDDREQDEHEVALRYNQYQGPKQAVTIKDK